MEVQTLEACSQRGPHPRTRRLAALAVLGHHRDQSLPQLTALFAVRYATVHGRRAARPAKLKLDAAAQKK